MISENLILVKNKRELTDIEKMKIHDAIQLIPQYELDELSDNLYNIIIENGEKKLKKHVLGTQIFRLFNIDRIATYVGIEKLIHGAIIATPDLLLGTIDQYSELKDILNSIL